MQTMDRLQDCFKETHWDLFKQNTTTNSRIDTNTSTVLNYYILITLYRQFPHTVDCMHAPQSLLNSALMRLLRAQDASTVTEEYIRQFKKL